MDDMIRFFDLQENSDGDIAPIGSRSVLSRLI
jgi:hypothetical protein